jgi:hypothetical protein
MKRTHDSVETYVIPHKRFHRGLLTTKDIALINTLPGHTREALYLKFEEERTRLCGRINQIKTQMNMEGKKSKRRLAYDEEITRLQKSKGELIAKFTPVFLEKYGQVRELIRENQGTFMDQLVYKAEATTVANTQTEFYDSNTFASAAIYCIMEELKQKGWKSELRFLPSGVHLVCDFTDV